MSQPIGTQLGHNRYGQRSRRVPTADLLLPNGTRDLQLASTRPENSPEAVVVRPVTGM
jgi:hypothetical protein